MSIRHNGFVLIGRRDSEYYFVTSVFDHGDGFQGATGSIVRPVCKDEWDWASDPENVAERLYDYWHELYGRAGRDGCRECEGSPHSDEGCESCGIESLDDFTARAIESDGIEHIMFDSSDKDEALAIFADFVEDIVTTDCSGGGRIFGRADWHGGDGWQAFDEVYNRKALVAIRALEDGNVSVDYAARIVFGR